MMIIMHHENSYHDAITLMIIQPPASQQPYYYYAALIANWAINYYAIIISSINCPLITGWLGFQRCCLLIIARGVGGGLAASSLPSS
jgi:hypothetical protein